MKDPRVTQLAGILVNQSTQVQPGDKVLIQGNNASIPLTRELVKAVYRAGGIPFPQTEDLTVRREMILGATKEQMDIMARTDAALMEQMDVFIGFTALENTFDLSDVPAEKMGLYQKYYSQPVHHDLRVPHTRWTVLRYPTPAMAQAAGMSREGFEDYFFKVCNVDYSALSKAMDPLKALMEKTDRVRITGPGTDLRFSIKDIPVVKCDGGMNIPDGEVYTAPVRDSVEGTIAYNCPAEYQGSRYDNIRLTFKGGKIVDAQASDTERINQVFDTDEGARFVGEFALGVNPEVTRPMMNALFDEKITGSLHFTPGNSYDDAPNGNHSAIHWDLVLIQTPAHGGGEIYFDDVLIRKDGIFTLPELQGLNPPAS